MSRKAPKRSHGDEEARPGTQRRSAKLKTDTTGRLKAVVPETVGKTLVRFLDDSTLPRAEGRRAVSRVVSFNPPQGRRPDSKKSGEGRK